jgi:hypothetical protein
MPLTELSTKDLRKRELIIKTDENRPTGLHDYNMIRQKYSPESTGATRPIADSPKSGSRISSNASLLPSKGTDLTLKLAGINP